MNIADDRLRSRLRASVSASLPRIVVVVAFAAAAAAFGSASGSEARFLGVAATVGLAAIALLDRPRGYATAGAAGAFLLLLAALPESPVRGLSVMGALALFGTALVSRRWAREGDLSFSATLGVALLFQVGFHPEWLLPGALGPVGIARLAVPPLAVTTVSRWSSRHQAPADRVIALLAVLTLGRGATTTGAVALLSPWIPEVAAALSRRGRGVLAAAAVGALFWRPTVVVAAALGGACRRARPLWMILSGAGLWGVTALLDGGFWPAPIATLVLLVPATLWPGLRRPGRTVGLLAFAAGASGWAGIGGAAVAAALVVARLGRDESLPAASLPWAGWVATASLLVSAYPWIRPGGLASLPLTAPVWVAVALVLLVAFVVLVQFPSRRGRVWALLVAGAWSAAAVALPGRGVDLHRDEVPVVLGRANRHWGANWERGRVGRVSLQLALSYSAELEEGRRVGWVGLLMADGEERVLPLVVGDTIGDWAAARDPGLAAPGPWIHWAAGDDFFGRRYRLVWNLDPPLTGVRRVRIVRREDLPREAGIIVWQLRVGP